MRIVAIADLHYDETRRPRVEAIANACRGARADVLVIAGDLADGVANIGETLALFEDIGETRLMVPGNHDLWQEAPPFETQFLYREAIPNIAAEHGFRCLDRGPVTVGQTAFVGAMGWYDYSMRQREAPSDNLTVTPVDVSLREHGQMGFSAVPGATETDWEGLEADDYAANGLVWQTDDDRPQVAVWSDPLHLDWEQPAGQVVAEMTGRIRVQVEEVGEQARHVVGVTHFVPFAELARYHLRTPRSAYAKAFLGSPLLGEALLEAVGLELVIYGHRHRQEVREVRGVVTADAAVTSGDAGPLLLTLPD